MNQNFNQFQGRTPGFGCWLQLLILTLIIGTIGITGLIKSIFVLVLFLVSVPVIAFLGLQFWVKRNLVQGSCPVCDQPLTGLKNMKTPCPSCGTQVSVTDEGFERAASDGVIDVQAVDVQASTVERAEDIADTAPVIDVEVQQLPEADG